MSYGADTLSLLAPKLTTLKNIYVSTPKLYYFNRVNKYIRGPGMKARQQGQLLGWR